MKNNAEIYEILFTNWSINAVFVSRIILELSGVVIITIQYKVRSG